MEGRDRNASRGNWNLVFPKLGPCPGVGTGPGAGCCHQPPGILDRILTFPLAKYNYLCYLFGSVSPKEPLLQAEKFEKSCNRSTPQPQGFSRVLRSVWFDSVLPLLRCADTSSRLCHQGLQVCDSHLTSLNPTVTGSSPKWK